MLLEKQLEIRQIEVIEPTLTLTNLHFFCFSIALSPCFSTDSTIFPNGFEMEYTIFCKFAGKRNAFVKPFRQTDADENHRTMDMKKIVNPWKGMAGYNCFGCAPDNPMGLHLEFFEEGDDIVTFWTPSTPYQGWEGIVHGGIQALLIDEVCGWVVTRKMQTAGVTMTMETRYLRPVSAGNKRLTIRARIREQQRNILFIDAEITDDTGQRCTEGSCKYYLFSHERAMKTMNFKPCHTEDEEETPGNNEE